MKRNSLEEKYSRIFAAKRYKSKDGSIELSILEQQELVDDLRDNRVCNFFSNLSKDINTEANINKLIDERQRAK